MLGLLCKRKILDVEKDFRKLKPGELLRVTVTGNSDLGNGFAKYEAEFEVALDYYNRLFQENPDEFNRIYNSASKKGQEFFDNLGIFNDDICVMSIPSELDIPDDLRSKLDEVIEEIENFKVDPIVQHSVVEPSTNDKFPRDALTYDEGCISWNVRFKKWYEPHRIRVWHPNLETEVSRISIEDFLEGLQERIDSFTDEISQGGLKGAIAARKQSILFPLYGQLEKAKQKDRIEIMNKDHRFPHLNSGFYILQEGENKPFVVKFKPGYSEDDIGKLADIFYRKEGHTAFEIPPDYLTKYGDQRVLQETKLLEP